MTPRCAIPGCKNRLTDNALFCDKCLLKQAGDLPKVRRKARRIQLLKALELESAPSVLHAVTEPLPEFLEDPRDGLPIRVMSRKELPRG